MWRSNKKKHQWTLGDERGSRLVYKNINRYRMERNLRMWGDDSREASPKVGDGGGDGDHVTDGFTTSGGGAGSEALRNGDGRG